MENGRVEPLRALPVHREAQPPVGQISTMYIDFPLDRKPQTQGPKPHADAPGQLSGGS